MLVETLTRVEALARDLPTPDIYFSPGYGASEEGPGLTWQVLAVEDQWLLPLVLQERDGYRDAMSPYGYAGIFAADSMTQSHQVDAWNAAQIVLRDAGITSLFLRRSPLIQQGWLPPDVTWVVRDHPTCAVKTEATSEMWSRMEGRCRTSIRKAERLGLEVELSAVGPDDLSAGAPFRVLYEAAMRRRAASTRYFFPDAYYVRLLSGIGEKLKMVTVRRDADTIAVALFMEHDQFLHYHLSGGLPEAGSLGATNLLIWEACKYASGRGLKTLHLGGGVAGRDSLYKFKSSFGGHELSFSAAGWVVNPSLYQERVVRRAEQLDINVEALSNCSTFPAYFEGALG